MGIRRYLFSVGTIFFGINASAAYSDYSSEQIHLLSIGSGISSPSITSALGENPAGLAYNSKSRFLGAAGWTNSDLNPLGLSGGVFLGNGMVGGGFQLQTFNGQGNNAGNITLFNFGIASDIPSMGISFGATGTYTINQSGSTYGTGQGTTWNSDIGIIINPHHEVRGGITAFQVLDGLDAVGAGIAADANSWATFAIDGSMTTKGQGKTVKPTMGIHLSDFSFTLGYGIGLDDDANHWVRRGTAFGVAINLGLNAYLQGYYNQLALYYVGLTLNL